MGRREGQPGGRTHAPRSDSSGAGEQTRSNEDSAQVTRVAAGNTAARGHRPGGGGSLGRRTPYPPTPEAKSRDEPSRKVAPLLHPEVSYCAPTQWL